MTAQRSATAGLKVVKIAKAASQPTERSPTLFRGLVRFCGEFRPPDFVIGRIIESGRVITITGVTGTGKTEFLKNIILATATGREDILGLPVRKGRVAILALENSDDLRNRLMVSAHVLGIDLPEIDRQVLIADRRETPEEVLRTMRTFDERLPLSLILIDTAQAFYDGKNINDPVEAGEFIRRVRRLTSLDGRPSVLIAAHPIKSASQDQLIPYGSGAILNEVDGNLTLWRAPQSDIVTLHSAGKFRGSNFDPLKFRFDVASCPHVTDTEGREIVLPLLRPFLEKDRSDTKAAQAVPSVKLLKAMLVNPDGPQRHWAGTLGCSQAMVGKRLQKLAEDGLATVNKGRWTLTPNGIQEAENASNS